MKSSLSNWPNLVIQDKQPTNINQITAGSAGNVNNASNALTCLANGGVTGQQVNDLAGQLYDSDTVKSQTSQLATDVNKSYNQQVEALNQQAVGSGNMGSSRAGVAHVCQVKQTRHWLKVLLIFRIQQGLMLINQARVLYKGISPLTLMLLVNQANWV